jgi:hypothetical protein
VNLVPDNKTKTIRIPFAPADQAALADLLGNVPNRKVVQYDWTSEPGRAFIKEARRLQVSGVPLPWIAEALELSPTALSGAVGYHERASTSRGSKANRRKREKRPLRKPGEAEG